MLRSIYMHSVSPRALIQRLDATRQVDWIQISRRGILYLLALVMLPISNPLVKRQAIILW
jgi:hypothetical protein